MQYSQIVSVLDKMQMSEIKEDGEENYIFTFNMMNQKISKGLKNCNGPNWLLTGPKRFKSGD